MTQPPIPRPVKIFVLLILLVGGWSFRVRAQELKHEVRVVNIEVPVRVFRGTAFVETLRLDDFELRENGVLQTIDAVYLVKKTAVARQEGAPAKAPRTARHFVLLFELTEFLPEIERVLDHFFERVIEPQDELIIVTPLKTYRMRSDSLARMPKARIEEQLLDTLRADIMMGSSEYRNALRELNQVMASDLPFDQKLQQYGTYRDRLENLRRVDEKKLVQFASILKEKDGPKYAFLFYQKELVPKISLQNQQMLMDTNLDRMDIVFSILEEFDYDKRDIRFDVTAVKQAFSDSSISVHFLFLTKTRGGDFDVEDMIPSEMTMTEKSEDIYGAFREIAAATGGITVSSANISASFLRAMDAAENYYLLYYTPKDYRPDGSFRDLKVTVKTGKYNISHRVGYFAR